MRLGLCDIQQEESERWVTCSGVSQYDAWAGRLQRRDPSGRGGRYHSSADSLQPERRAEARFLDHTTPLRGGGVGDMCWGKCGVGGGVRFIQKSSFLSLSLSQLLLFKKNHLEGDIPTVINIPQRFNGNYNVVYWISWH